MERTQPCPCWRLRGGGTTPDRNTTCGVSAARPASASWARPRGWPRAGLRAREEQDPCDPCPYGLASWPKRQTDLTDKKTSVSVSALRQRTRTPPASGGRGRNRSRVFIFPQPSSRGARAPRAPRAPPTGWLLVSKAKSL